jgi:tetratricopeptide (TPR) repeat protein
MLPLPLRLRRHRRMAAAAALLLASVAPAHAQSNVTGEVLLRPTRRTAEGRKLYAEGNQPRALEAFNQAAAARPADPRARFNVADALYKSNKLDEARAIYEQLAADARSPLAAPSRYNLGNTLYQTQDYAGAVRAYRGALRLTPNDLDTRRNLELALRALQQEQQTQDQDQKDKEKEQGGGGGQKQSPQQQGQGNQGAQGQQGQKQERPQTEEEKEKERFEKETGMPKERAMQLLNALQQNEKNEQKKLQADRRKVVPRTKDW